MQLRAGELHWGQVPMQLRAGSFPHGADELHWDLSPMQVRG